MVLTTERETSRAECVAPSTPGPFLADSLAAKKWAPPPFSEPSWRWPWGWPATFWPQRVPPPLLWVRAGPSRGAEISGRPGQASSPLWPRRRLEVAGRQPLWLGGAARRRQRLAQAEGCVKGRRPMQPRPIDGCTSPTPWPVFDEGMQQPMPRRGRRRGSAGGPKGPLQMGSRRRGPSCRNPSQPWRPPAPDAGFRAAG